MHFFRKGTFPVKNSKQIWEFMCEKDGKMEDRRLALEKLLLTVCNPQGDNKQRTFNDALINVLFTRDYYSTHQWPSK